MIHQHADTGFLLSNQYVDRIVIPPITSQNQPLVTQIESLLDQILNPKSKDCSTDISSFEKQIDQLVYNLYGLTDEEIKVIESN